MGMGPGRPSSHFHPHPTAPTPSPGRSETLDTGDIRQHGGFLVKSLWPCQLADAQLPGFCICDVSYYLKRQATQGGLR